MAFFPVFFISNFSNSDAQKYAGKTPFGQFGCRFFQCKAISFSFFSGRLRAFSSSTQLPEAIPSGFAGAPKVASAPRGNGSASFARYLLQSLPPNPLIPELILLIF
jgi:hypothetical protein